MPIPRHIQALLAGPLLAILCGVLTHSVVAQDIAGYRIQEKDNIFGRETQQSLSLSPSVDHFPLIDCAIEYIRRQDGKEIVYRRGPISMHQLGLDRPELKPMNAASQPASEQSETRKPYFVGGILVDLPKTGEATNHVSQQDDYRYYMIRVSLIPQAYADGVLSSRILLERAIVNVEDETIKVLSSEVFSRSIEITGNDPLNFTLPSWEKEDAAHRPLIPKSLEEALLVTLETPRHFAFSENYPEPFSKSTRLQYSVPVSSAIALSIRMNDREKVVEEGRREPGTYQVILDGSDLPDGRIDATLEAKNDDGQTIHEGTMNLTRSKDAPEFSLPRYTPSVPPVFERFVVSLESGFAYQFPADEAKSFRNMFTHISARLGYRLSSSVELGIFAAQDAFHEYPGPEVDTERIPDYGGVVGYTYGHYGVYSRFAFGTGLLQPLTQISVGVSNAAPITDIGFGIRAQVFPRIQLTVLPSVMMHWKKAVSTKAGIQYGVSMRL